MVNNLRLLRGHFRLSQADLAKRMGTSRSQYVKLERGERRLTDKWIERASSAFGVPPSAVIEPFGFEPEHNKIWGSGNDSSIFEIGGLAQNGGLVHARENEGPPYEADGASDRWGIPEEFVRYSLKCNPKKMQILEILGDSMAPTLQSGDRVFVDTSHTSPSPPGLYAVWDGGGVVVKRVEFVPLSDPPILRMTSDNAHHSPYEVAKSEARIVGRICARLNVL